MRGTKALQFVLPALLLFASFSGIWAEQRYFRCRATDPRTKKLVFTCHGYEIRRHGTLLKAEITYRTARGKLFGKEKINFRKDAQSPDVLFEDLRDGRREMVEKEADTYSIVIQDSAKDQPQFARLKHPGGDDAVLTMPGLPAYLLANLVKQPVESRLVFRVVFPHERKMLTLRATHEGFIKYHRRDAMRVRVQAQNFVYRWFSEPVYLTIQKKTGHLLRYQGLHYVRDPETGHGSIVDLTFSW